MLDDIFGETEYNENQIEERVSGKLHPRNNEACELALELNHSWEPGVWYLKRFATVQIEENILNTGIPPLVINEGVLVEELPVRFPSVQDILLPKISTKWVGASLHVTINQCLSQAWRILPTGNRKAYHSQNATPNTNKVKSAFLYET